MTGHEKRGRCHTPSAAAVARFHMVAIEATFVTDRERIAANPDEVPFVRSAGRHEWCVPARGQCVQLVEIPPGMVLHTRVVNLFPGGWSRKPVLVGQDPLNTGVGT